MAQKKDILHEVLQAQEEEIRQLMVRFQSSHQERGCRSGVRGDASFSIVFKSANAIVGWLLQETVCRVDDEIRNLPAQRLFHRLRVVEAGCKTVIGSRCKQSGMFWSQSGAQNVLALRCIHSSRRLSEFWKDRLNALAASNDSLDLAA